MNAKQQAAQAVADQPQWAPIIRPGQVKVGAKLRFTIGDKKYSETARLILHSGTENEEIIYNKRQNYYLITSMAIQNKGSQRNVEYVSAPEAQARAEMAQLTASLRDLTMAVWRQHYRDTAPQFELLDDARSILSQLDNMLTGLTRSDAAAAPKEPLSK